MTRAADILSNAVAVRRRLRNPPNAVRDHPITLRRGWPVPPAQAEAEPPADAAPVEEPPAPAPPIAPAEPEAMPEWLQLMLQIERDRVADSETKAPPEPEPPLVRRIRANDIIAAVANDFNIPINVMLSHRRPRPVVRPRMIAMDLCRSLTLLSFTQIGQRFNGRDHTTVMSATRRLAALRAADPDLDARIAAIEAKLRASCEGAAE